MLRTCEEFALSHNLVFSTDPDPAKCKTKTLAFLKKPRSLPNLVLCGNPLPWTDRCKHLGISVENKIDGCELEMKMKKAQYIRRNLVINQEFFFAHPTTKLKINQIYNSHFSGSPIWDLFGKGAVSLEASYKKSMKVMLGLPPATHRCLIEPVSGYRHLKLILIQSFLGFMEKIDKSEKKALKM